MMSSYHIINTIWIGIFPMVVVSLIVGLICYFLCCLTQLKASLKEYRKNQSFKRNKKLHRQQQRLASKTSLVNVKETTNDETKKLSEPKSLTNDIKSINLHVNPLNSQTKSLYQPPDTNIITRNDFVKKFDRNSLHLKLTSNNNEIIEEQIKRECENDEPNREGTSNKPRNKSNKKESESELEQLVVMELDESPKSVYFRLKQLGFRSRDNINESEKAESTEKPKIESTRLTSSQIKSIDSLEEDSNISYSSHQPKSFYENLNEIITTTNENDGKEYLSDNNYKYRKKMKKKLFKYNTDQEEQTTPTSFKSTSNDDLENNTNRRAKLIILKKRSKDAFNSDIEIEEDLICDGDSLSSTGMSCERVSENTFVNNMKTSRSSFKSSESLITSKTLATTNNLANTRKDMFSFDATANVNKNTDKPLEVTEIKQTNSPILPNSKMNDEQDPSLFRTANTDSKHGELTKLKNSSMSDIEPDENLLRNLLIKNPSSN